MLNEDLFDKKDLKILHLKQAIKFLNKRIENFKAYDKQRREYYSFLVNDWQNSEAKDIIQNLQEKLRKAEAEIHRLQQQNDNLIKELIQLRNEKQRSNP